MNLRAGADGSLHCIVVIEARDFEAQIEKKWILVGLHLEGVREFRFVEAWNHCNIVITQGLHIEFMNGITYLDFGSLYDLDNMDETYTVEDLRTSEFYVGGRSVKWSLIEMGGR